MLNTIAIKLLLGIAIITIAASSGFYTCYKIEQTKFNLYVSQQDAARARQIARATAKEITQNEITSQSNLNYANRITALSVKLTRLRHPRAKHSSPVSSPSNNSSRTNETRRIIPAITTCNVSDALATQLQLDELQAFLILQGFNTD